LNARKRALIVVWSGAKWNEVGKPWDGVAGR
jgi:hypothetical protein